MPGATCEPTSVSGLGLPQLCPGPSDACLLWGFQWKVLLHVLSLLSLPVAWRLEYCSPWTAPELAVCLPFILMKLYSHEGRDEEEQCYNSLSSLCQPRSPSFLLSPYFLLHLTSPFHFLFSLLPFHLPATFSLALFIPPSPVTCSFLS